MANIPITGEVKRPRHYKSQSLCPTVQDAMKRAGADFSPGRQLLRFFVASVAFTALMASAAPALSAESSVRLNPTVAPDFIMTADGENVRLARKANTGEFSIRLMPVEDAADAPIFRILPLGGDGYLNIQDGTPTFNVVPEGWWSAQWLIKAESGSIRIISRWKPALALGIDSNGQLVEVAANHESALWSLHTIDQALLARLGLAAEVEIAAPTTEPQNAKPPAKEEIALATQIEQQNNVAVAEATVVADGSQPSESQVARIDPSTGFPIDDESATRSIETANGEPKPEIQSSTGEGDQSAPDAQPISQQPADIAPAQARPLVAQQNKPAPAVVAKQPASPATQAPVQTPQQTARTTAPQPETETAQAPQKVLRPVPEAVVQSIVQTQQKPRLVTPPPKGEKAEDKKWWQRIKREFTAATLGSTEVGPTQAGQKFYVNSLFKEGDHTWLLFDSFGFGEELLALRGGYVHPLFPKEKIYLRYGFNASRIIPFIDPDEISELDIFEHDHKLELYKVTAGEGYYNETGFALLHTNFDLTRLSANADKPDVEAFTTYDVGLFTGGFWRKEDENHALHINYRLSVEAGLDVFSASDSFDNRVEAEAFPLVVKGTFDVRKDWKEYNTYLDLKSGFHYADRITEFHKQLAIGGNSFTRGFDAGEAGAELTLAASLQYGKSYARKMTFFDDELDIDFIPFAEIGVGATQSLFDSDAEDLQFNRDTVLGSAAFGLKTKTEYVDVEVGYGLPVFGESRFDEADSGRFFFSTKVRW